MTTVTTPHVTAPSPGSDRPALSWQRIALIVVLLNLPTFFHGCGPNHRTNFTLGAIIPYAEITDVSNRSGLPAAVNHWSWTRFTLNYALTVGAVWLLCHRSSWTCRVAQSRLSIVTLAIVVVVFNSWLYLPFIWLHLVFTPTWHLFMAMLWPLGREGGTHPVCQHYALLISSRLHYAVCLIGVGATAWALRGFLRKYFFVRSGHWWQVQLGGLMIAVLVVGTVIGMVARLLMG